MTEVPIFKTNAPVRSRLVSYIWLLPVVGAAVYGDLIGLYVQFIKSAVSDAESSMSAAGAALVLALLFAVPFSALFILIKFSRILSHRVRSILFLVCTVPALGGPVIHILEAVNLIQWYRPAWFSIWGIAVLIALIFRSPTSAFSKDEPVSTWLRVSHGVVALLLLTGFLVFHLLNHLGAFWSVELHGQIATFLRGWYQSEWVEPFLLLFIVFMIVSGVTMVMHYARFQSDNFRIVQIACGAYLAAFFGSHVPTVLKARAANIETDWFFAVSQNGLLDPSRAFLTPYYIMAINALVMHVFLGLRVVLLAHGMQTALVNRIFYGLASASLLVNALIIAAMFDFHIM